MGASAPIFFAALRSLPTVAINGHDLRSCLLYGHYKTRRKTQGIVNMLSLFFLTCCIYATLGNR